MEATEGFSGAEVVALVQGAALEALRENLSISHVETRHFERALGKIEPQITREMLSFYENYQRKDV